MRTLSGMMFLSSEMTMLEQMSTTVAAMPMPMPLTAIVVTASVGQVPRMRTRVGFSLRMPFVRTLQLLGLFGLLI